MGSPKPPKILWGGKTERPKLQVSWPSQREKEGSGELVWLGEGGSKRNFHQRGGQEEGGTDARGNHAGGAKEKYLFFPTDRTDGKGKCVGR